MRTAFKKLLADDGAWTFEDDAAGLLHEPSGLRVFALRISYETEKPVAAMIGRDDCMTEFPVDAEIADRLAAIWERERKRSEDRAEHRESDKRDEIAQWIEEAAG